MVQHNLEKTLTRFAIKGANDCNRRFGIKIHHTQKMNYFPELMILLAQKVARISPAPSVISLIFAEPEKQFWLTPEVTRVYLGW